MYVYGTITGGCVCTCMVLPLGAVYVRVWYYHWGLCMYAVLLTTCMLIAFFSAFSFLCMVVVVVCITKPQLFHTRYSHVRIYSAIALTYVCVHAWVCARMCACMRACLHVCNVARYLLEPGRELPKDTCYQNGTDSCTAGTQVTAKTNCSKYQY